jgi:signal peptidase II
MDSSLKNKLPPVFLGAAVIVADQAVKAAIVAVSGNKIGLIARWWNDLVFIVHQRNLAAAFSILDGLPFAARMAFLVALPALVLIAVLVYYFRSSELTSVQRWFLLAAVGGGFGNLIDRAFRPMGVVDFISVKFFGIFGLTRWPTFNLADSALVVGAIALIISFIVQGLGRSPADGSKAGASK